MSPPQRHRKPVRHVLMTADTVGGVWTYAMELCRGLDRRGVMVALLTMGRMPDAAQEREAAALPNVSLISTDYRLEWMRHCKDDLERSGELLHILDERLKPDIIHINGYWHAALPFSAPRMVVAHSCVASWWKACRRTYLPNDWNAYRSWVRKAVLGADMLVAPTAAFLREFQRLHGKAAHARVIWNGRDREKFAPDTKQNLVLAAGRLWDEAKNISMLCKAARKLDLKIAVAGDDSGPEGDLAIMDHVTVLGRLTPEELARWMSHASIFVAPARYEPFGLTILEAALSGCALVLGDIPTLRELWDGAAMFVDPDDDAGLRHTLRMLAQHNEVTADFGRRARARAEAFSTERMADAYYEAYSTLAAPRLEAVA